MVEDNYWDGRQGRGMIGSLERTLTWFIVDNAGLSMELYSLIRSDVITSIADLKKRPAQRELAIDLLNVMHRIFKDSSEEVDMDQFDDIESLLYAIKGDEK